MQRNADLKAINSEWHALIEIAESMNSVFTLAVACVVALCFGLSASFAVIQPSGVFLPHDIGVFLPHDIGVLFGLLGAFVLFFAARLGDDWTRVQVQLTGALAPDFVQRTPHSRCEPLRRQLISHHPSSGPVSRTAMIKTLGASLGEGYLAGFDRTVLGVQLFNVVVTTPRLLYSVFALMFIILNLLVTRS